MVLPDARAELREALSALVAGQLTNDEFDDVYYRLCERSPDRAVEEIGAFGYGLYSSDLPWPYRLTGRNAVDAEIRAMAERCDLFLQSRLEYEWPPFPRLGWVLFVQALAVAPGCLVSLLAVILVPLALSNHAWLGAGIIAVIAALIVLSSLWLYRYLGRSEEWRRAEYWSSGPRDVWPFFSEEEFQRASHANASIGT